MNAPELLLSDLIRLPSFSREEDATAQRIAGFLEAKGIPTQRLLNNVWAQNAHFDPQKPTLLLNSHHDTVRPNPGYTRDPFLPQIEDGKLYGLGSNDAGAALVGLIFAFLHFYSRPDLPYNLCLAATAEEEISGKHGIAYLLPHLPPLACAIVGEPTEMHLAIAERGLIVIDAEVKGKAGHAARLEGENAIYKALSDIDWMRAYRFPKQSPTLGEVRMSVTQIEAGTQHNVVPDSCRFVVDVRTTDAYTNEEVLAILDAHTQATLRPRSLRLKPSGIAPEHPLVQAGVALGRHTYGSPTMSDQALLDIPSIKMGPGHSARSHTADEFVYLDELHEGIKLYVALLERFFE